jgi:hypothetical protein
LISIDTTFPTRAHPTAHSTHPLGTKGPYSRPFGWHLVYSTPLLKSPQADTQADRRTWRPGGPLLQQLQQPLCLLTRSRQLRLAQLDVLLLTVGSRLGALHRTPGIQQGDAAAQLLPEACCWCSLSCCLKSCSAAQDSRQTELGCMTPFSSGPGLPPVHCR